MNVLLCASRLCVTQVRTFQTNAWLTQQIPAVEEKNKESESETDGTQTEN